MTRLELVRGCAHKREADPSQSTAGREDGFACVPGKRACTRTDGLPGQTGQMRGLARTGTQDALRSREQRDDESSGELHGRNCRESKYCGVVFGRWYGLGLTVYRVCTELRSVPGSS